MLCIASLALTLASAAPPDPLQAEHQRQQAKAAMFASPRIGPVASPDRVEVLPVEDLLDQLKPGEVASDLGLPAHFRVIDKPKPLDVVLQRELKRVLMNPRSYSDGVSACAFQPFVAFRHWSGKSFVDVYGGRDCFQVALAESGRELLGYYPVSERARKALEVVVARSLSQK